MESPIEFIEDLELAIMTDKQLRMYGADLERWRNAMIKDGSWQTETESDYGSGVVRRRSQAFEKILKAQSVVDHYLKQL